MSKTVMQTARKPYDSTPSPRQTLAVGTRVALRHRRFAYGQEGYDFGVILGYATPEIKMNQCWTAESYYVRFDRDPQNSRGRVFDRHAISVIPA